VRALSPNDEKIGLPRLLLATAVSRCETIDEAAAMAEHVQRASSYNWVLADRHGAAVSIEGSATNAVHLKPDSRGFLHHENHYADPAMARYEFRNDVAERSRVRGRRMDELLAHMRVGQLSPRSLRTLLSDHANSPESICRHVTEEDRQQTVFWTVAEPASNASRSVSGSHATRPAPGTHFIRRVATLVVALMRSRGSDNRYRTFVIAEAISTGEGGGVMHGPTFMGNPLSCAVAVAAVELLLSRDWRAELSSLTAGLTDGLMPARDLASVPDVRVLGGIGVIELHSPADMRTATATAVDAGVWLRAFRNLIYAMPPDICDFDDIATITAGVIAARSQC
jgi:hypothetical protein